MIGVRLGGETIWLEAPEWERWVEDGRIPAEAPVLFPGGTWVPAGAHPQWRRLAARAMPPPPAPAPDLRRVVFPPRGLSATETVLFVNVLAGIVPMLLWSADYGDRLTRLATHGWSEVRFESAFWWWLPTLVVHADPTHLASNLVALLIGAGFTEYLVGGRRTIGAYLVTGLAGAAVSYAAHDGPPLSVGASGAAFGYLGLVAGFVVRRGASFSPRQRWKARRVYAPLLLFLAVPALFRHDLYAHMGGFVAGGLAGLLARPHRRLGLGAGREEFPPAG